MGAEKEPVRAGAETKARIYQAAVDSFYELGYNGASLRTIGKAAEARMSSIYYHYRDKEDLLFEVMTIAVGGSTKLIESRLEGVTGAAERLKVALEALVEWHTANQREAFIADAELPRLEGERRAEVIRLRDHEEQLIRGILEEGDRSGEFRVPDVALVNRMLMSAVTGVAGWYRPGGKHEPRGIADTYYRALMDGLRVDRE